MDLVRENWDVICNSLKKEYDLLDTAFNTWVKPLEYSYTKNNTVFIAIQNDQDMHFEYIKKKYTDLFKIIINEVTGLSYEVEFIRKSEIENNVDSLYNSAPSVSKIDNSNTDSINSINLNPKYKFEDFVVGSNNKLAYSACLAVAETPGEVYNPLYIYGDPGLGKTHLMHSIGHMILEQDPKKKIIYVTSEEFTNEVIKNMISGDALSMAKIREKYRTVDVLMVDDIQFIIGKDATQEEFFHTFNALHEAHKQIVISSDRPPKEIQNLDERFKSRFAWGITVDIKNPDYETRMAILKKNAEKLEVVISEDIIQYIATNIKSNIRELEGALNKVVMHSRLNSTLTPTLEIAENALKDMINPEKTVITAQKIIDTVAEVYGIKSSDILSQKRNQEYAIPRMVVMYLCFDILSMSYSSIAKLLEKKDHTTIIHGCNKIKSDIKSDDILVANIDNIRKKLS